MTHPFQTDFQMKWDPDVVGRCVSSLRSRWFQGNEGSADLALGALTSPTRMQAPSPGLGHGRLAHCTGHDAWSIVSPSKPINK